MPVSPADFGTMGQDIDADYSSEIAKRAAISRMYYCGFHFVRENATRPNNFSYGPGDHKEAVEYLKRIGEKTSANRLMQMKKLRQKADYDLQKTVTQTETSKQNGTMRNFLSGARGAI